MTLFVTLIVRKKEMVLWSRYRSRAPQSYSWPHRRFPAQSGASDITSLCLHFFLSKACLVFIDTFITAVGENLLRARQTNAQLLQVLSPPFILAEMLGGIAQTALQTSQQVVAKGSINSPASSVMQRIGTSTQLTTETGVSGRKGQWIFHNWFFSQMEMKSWSLVKGHWGTNLTN